MVPNVRLVVDRDAQASYIYLTDHPDLPVAETREINECVNVDLNEYGVAIGIEVFGLQTEIPWAQLIRDCHVHSEVEEYVRLITPSVHGFIVQLQPAGATRLVDTSTLSRA